jgi:hypothetical protein
VNGRGPQWYTHCFTVNITGTGNVEPQGVKFPGAYKRLDPGVKFILFANKETWKDYVRIRGPALHNAPLLILTRSSPVRQSMLANTMPQPDLPQSSPTQRAAYFLLRSSKPCTSN